MSKLLIFIILILVIVAGVGFWFWQNRPEPVVVNPTPQGKPVEFAPSNVKSYEGNTLPPQFPKDLPNPAKEGDVVKSESMVLNGSTSGGSIAVDQSVYKFNTKSSPEDILKIYNNYFTKNGWVVSLSPANPFLMRGGKGATNIVIVVTPKVINVEGKTESDALVSVTISVPVIASKPE